MSNKKCSEDLLIGSWGLFAVGSIFFIIGITTYLFFYPEKFKCFGDCDTWGIEPYKVTIILPFLKVFIYSITSYCHVIFMTFFSVLVTGNANKFSILKWAFTWGLIDSIFEVLQLYEGSIQVDENYSFFAYLLAYLKYGQFSMYDILFIWLGVLSALFIPLFIKKLIP